jgi:hypothetical protein
MLKILRFYRGLENNPLPKPKMETAVTIAKVDSGVEKPTPLTRQA